MKILGISPNRLRNKLRAGGKKLKTRLRRNGGVAHSRHIPRKSKEIARVLIHFKWRGRPPVLPQ